MSPQHIDRYEADTTIAPPTAQLRIVAVTASDKAVVETILTDPASRKVVAEAKGQVVDGGATLKLSAPKAELWTDETPKLYDLKLQLLVDGQVTDTVDSYLGFRTVEARDGAFFLNGKRVWLCGALDQGYWPQSLYTHPSDEAAIEDIKWVKRLGLNHIRKHQMMPDPRFLYHCDRLGLLVWGEMANAASRCMTARSTAIAQRQWLREIQRDYNHPCIVTWVYSNENWMHGGTDEARIDHYRKAYHQMKAWDVTRPIIDTSGYYHVASDILDIRYYEPQRRLVDPYLWAQGQLPKPSENIVFLADMPYEGQPIVVSEWVLRKIGDHDSQRQHEWLRAYLARLALFASHPLCAGHCYVQLYDVESERNGYLYYDRRSKMDPQVEAAVRDAHIQATQRDLAFDWNAFIEARCPSPENGTEKAGGSS